MPACPRCKDQLVQRAATPAGGTSQITADLCERCQGLWFDGAELAHVSPALGGLPIRLAELAELASESAIRCPRCAGAMSQFDLLDIPIDLCGDCHGVWLDGGEYEGLARAEAPPAGAAGAARSRARSAPDHVACKACGQRTPLSGTYYTDQGVVCADCYTATEAGAMEQRGRATAAQAAAYDRAYGPGTEHWRRTHPLETQLAEMGSALEDLRDDVWRLRRQSG